MDATMMVFRRGPSPAEAVCVSWRRGVNPWGYGLTLTQFGIDVRSKLYAEGVGQGVGLSVHTDGTKIR